MWDLMFVSMKICFAVYKICLQTPASLWTCSVFGLCDYTLKYKPNYMINKTKWLTVTKEVEKKQSGISYGGHILYLKSLLSVFSQ